VKPVVLHDEAVAELHEAAAWYEQHRPGLGAEFRAAVWSVVSRIRQNPQTGGRFRATRFRYLLVRRFPYVVFFAEGGQVIRVLAIAHARRKPGYWTRRGIN
jgi:plasmid stabilization system protein ParE